MNRRKLILMIAVCMLAAACQKRKYPEEKVQLQQEDIYATGYIDNEPFTLKIGTEGYYCYSSYKQSTDSVYVFKGDLRKYDCNPCPLSLQVEFTDYRQRLIGASIPADSVLRPGSRSFIPGLPRVQKLKLMAHANKEVSSFRWEFSDGTSSQDSVLHHDFGQPGPQMISLIVRTKGNCESRVENTVFVGGETDLFACTIAASTLQNNLAQFASNLIGGKAPYRYTWNFGDGNTSNLPAPGHNYLVGGSYPVKLQVVDAENHVCESNFIYVTANDNSSCAANMSLAFAGSRKAFLNGVKIQWTDRSNVVLRSDSIAQPAESYVEVLNSQAYAANERGESGRLLTLRFKVLLSGGNRKVWFKSENTTIAVSYK